MTGLEYGRKGFVGALTPQANTTVEPEFAILLPPGVGFLTARLVSNKSEMEARLIDYFETMGAACKQFANAPIGVHAFACTGSSYLAGRAKEDAAISAIEAQTGKPFVTAGIAVAEMLSALSAQRIGLVSPYPPGLTKASIAYWQSHAFEVSITVDCFQDNHQFHPIYAMSSAAASTALDRLEDADIDAIVFLGTGMPTLRPILAAADRGLPPAISCMSALAWRCLAHLQVRAADLHFARAWARGEDWRDRLEARGL